MKHFAIAFAALSFAAAGTLAHADLIPYPDAGTPAPYVPVFATSHGITVYFDGSSAGFDDYVSVYDPSTGYSSGEFFEGHTTALGASLTLGTGTGTNSINAGDQLVFEIESGNGDTYAAVPAYSADGSNHGYITAYTADMSGIPTGLYVGFEDEGVPGGDEDYNDDSLVFTGVSAPTIGIGATPEPSSLVLLGTGLISACGVARRKLSKR